MGILSQFKSLNITSTPPKSPRVIPNSDTTNQEMPSSTSSVTTNQGMTSSSTSASQWIYETVKCSHEFKIKGYSLAMGKGVGESMTSPEFTVGGYDWVIDFYPEGYSQSYEEYISLFLKLVSPKKQVRAMLELKLLDQTGNGIHSIRAGTTSPKAFNGGNHSWGCMEFMKRSELETSSYLKDDCLSIHCTVEVVQEARVETVKEEKHYVISIPPSDMIQNLQGLLESGIGFDVTFQVGNELFRAHKLILAARSPVFRAMFFGSVGNPDMETVAIEEFDPFAFKAMLRFIYSDEFPELHENSDSDSPCTSTIIVQHLLAAADRFDLDRLRLMCEATLCKEITVDTVATTLALAEQHRCLQLKTFCLSFLAKAENLQEFMKSDGFGYLEKSCPSLLIDLLKTSVVMDTNVA